MSQAMPSAASAQTAPASERSLIAPLWHTILFVVLVMGLSATGYFLTRRLEVGATLPGRARQTVYLFTLVEEWVLFAFVYLGIRSRGMTVRAAIRARWTRGRDVWRDIAIALLVLVLFVAIEGIGSALFHHSTAAGSKVLSELTPHTLGELFLWLALSTSAGFCEEFMFRGYLQEQFRRLTGSRVWAIVIQAAFFGAGHGYQGWALMLTIFFIGLLFGVVVAWRKSLAPTMITHGLADSIGGISSYIQHAFPRV